MTATITLTTAGSDTGPFLLFSDVDGFTSAFESGISRISLLAGYTTALVPDGTQVIRVMSAGDCKNFIDITLSFNCSCLTLSADSDVCSFAYLDCDGVQQTPTLYPGDSISVCGVSPIITSGKGAIVIGGLCISGECPPTPVPQRCNGGGNAHPTSWRIEGTWENPQYIFELMSFNVDGIEYATGGDILTVNAPADLVTAAGIVYPGEIYIQNINNWLNSIPTVAGTGLVFYDNMSVIDTPDVSTTFSIRIKRTIPFITGPSTYNYWYIKNNTCMGFSCNINRLVEPTCAELYKTWTCSDLPLT
jgi:hypothetical protein